MTDYKYKLVDGTLVELTAAEIAEFKKLEADALVREEAAEADPSPTQEKPSARRTTRRQ